MSEPDNSPATQFEHYLQRADRNTPLRNPSKRGGVDGIILRLIQLLLVAYFAVWLIGKL